jgi:hypothetical protein
VLQGPRSHPARTTAGARSSQMAARAQRRAQRARAPARGHGSNDRRPWCTWREPSLRAPRAALRGAAGSPGDYHAARARNRVSAPWSSGGASKSCCSARGNYTPPADATLTTPRRHAERGPRLGVARPATVGPAWRTSPSSASPTRPPPSGADRARSAPRRGRRTPRLCRAARRDSPRRRRAPSCPS